METIPGVLLEERKHLRIIKKSIMAALKCKNILLLAILKDFCIKGCIKGSSAGI